MPDGITNQRENWPWTPLEVFHRWPRDRALAMLCSCPKETGPGSGEHAQWSFLAEPERMVTIGLDEPDPLGRLSEVIAETKIAEPRLGAGGGCPSPFAGGWMVALSYELGARLEPAAGALEPERDWPWAIVLWRCPSVLAFDHDRGEWWRIGRGGAGPSAFVPEQMEAGGSRSELSLSPVGPLARRDNYERAVARAVEYTHAGDIFQVNLSHRLGGAFEGSTRRLFERLATAAAPWYGAYLECQQGDAMHTALSLSPELFLDVDAASRIVTTRPIKGTRRGEEDPETLRESGKDQAELNMIVDLMRNDLGRVCEAGSVRVAAAREIERHGGTGAVHHGVATVRGTLRSDWSIAELLRATFPAGSITGAPKIRAMQIIRELEGRSRGLYTGAIGYISDCGNVSLNVAIRTAVVRGRCVSPRSRADEIVDGRLTYGAGAGIVADSVPAMEWQETLDKARPIVGASGRPECTITTRPHPQGVPA